MGCFYDLMDFGMSVANFKVGGWKLAKPNCYDFDFGHGRNLNISLNTNFKNNFSMSFKFTF